jgi:hypothetical protein
MSSRKYRTTLVIESTQNPDENDWDLDNFKWAVANDEAKIVSFITRERAGEDHEDRIFTLEKRVRDLEKRNAELERVARTKL